MAQEKRNFLGGLNKDLDTRLVKNGDYTHALNVRVASSTDGTVGAIENIEGNDLVPTDFYSSSQEVLFVNNNGVYEEINPTTVLHEKVIRISGWEEANVDYSFSLFSTMDDGDSRHIGDFSWVGASDKKNTASYLISQFSEFSQFGTGIPIYDLNTWSEYTASVKLMTFNQYTELSGGYLEIVIQADVSGVNFNLFGEFNGEGSGVYSKNTIPITGSGNLTMSIEESFDTGGLSNTDTTDGGIVVSPDGNIVEADNRTVYQLSITGIEPTSAADLTNITLFSYRENSYNSSETYDVEPLIEVTDGLFNSGDTYPFDSNQDNLSQWLSFVFSTSKTIIANDIPISFVVPSSNFFATFSSGDTLLDGGELKVTIVGPPGVRFKLALASGAESLASTLNGLEDNDLQYQALNSSGLTMIISPVNVLTASSIELSGSIYESYNQVSSDLTNALENVGELEQYSTNLFNQFTQSQDDLTAQIALTDATQDNLDQAVIDLNQAEQVNEQLQSLNDAAIIQVDTLNEESGILQTSYENLLDTNQNLNDQIVTLTLNANIADVTSNAQDLLDDAMISLLNTAINNLNNDYQDYIETSGEVISGYEDNINDLSNQLSSLIGQSATTAQDIFLLEQQVASLLQQVEEVNISELIVEKTFDQVQEIYNSAVEDYESSLIIYDSLSIPTQSIVYSQDFSPGNSYPNQVFRYHAVFAPPFAELSQTSNTGFVQLPQGNQYINSLYTAINIPKSSFSGGEHWLPGRNISLQISFDAVIVNQNNNCKVAITNFWDQSQGFEALQNQLLFQEFTIYSGTGGSVNTNPQTFNFTIPADHDVNDLSLNNIVIVGLNSSVTNGSYHNKARITNVSIISSSDGIDALNGLHNQSSDSHNQYLETQTSVGENISNISNDPDIINEVSEFLIPGFNENGSAILWDHLTLFLEKSSEFSSSLQTYLYELYQSYSNALTTSQADIQSLQDTYQQNVNEQDILLSEAYANVNALTTQLEPLSEVLFGNSYVFTDAPYVLAQVLTIYGVETGLFPSQYTSLNFLTTNPLQIKAKLIINGETQYSDPFTLLSSDQLSNLDNIDHSSTNNTLYYLRQNITTSGYLWEFDVLGYGTQKANIYWSNFTQDDNSMDGFLPSFNVVDGVSLSGLNTTYEDFSGSGGAQLMITFDTRLEGQAQVVTAGSGVDGIINFVLSDETYNVTINIYGNNQYPYNNFGANLSTISDPTTY